MSINKTTYDPTKKLCHGQKSPCKFGPDYSIGRAIIEALQKDPEHIGQICYHNGKQYTDREIYTLSIRVAQHFENMGLPQCTVIGICAANSDYIAPLFFGAMLEGLTVSTRDPSSEKDGIRQTFSMTKPKLMFCDGSIYTKVSVALQEAHLDCKIYTMQQHVAGVPEITEFLAETGREMDYKIKPLQDGYDQAALIVCSSGTTGLPKGVCVSHAALLRDVSWNRTQNIIMLSFSTLYWISGIHLLLLGTMMGASRVISANGFTPEDFFDIIEKYQITAIFTPPSQISLSLASSKIKTANLSSLRLYMTGGTAVPGSIAQNLKPYIPNAKHLVGYGLSEVGGGISAEESSSSGQLLDNIDMKVINSEGELLGPGEVGEICLRTPFKWAGCNVNTQATAKMLDDEGWLHSGDFGYISSDGNVYVIDRLKEILKYNNLHFYQTEIEHVISELPGVSEICVCGLPDDVSSFLSTAAMVHSKDSKLTENTVLEYVARNMDHFKQLRGGVYFVDSLPESASGKCLRRNVIRIC